MIESKPISIDKNKITLTMDKKYYLACWHSLKCMLDNKIPAPSEVPNLIRAMEEIAKAVDGKTNEQIIS